MDHTSGTLTNLEKARRYLKFLEDGSFADIAGLFAPGMVMEQLPNRIYPKGIRHSVSEMAEGFEKGRKLLASQAYQIENEVVSGNSIALEVLWKGRLAVALGTLQAGSEMQAHSAMFLEFQDGKIVSQRNYDCFEPW
jgi:ketosteroid isomerase-like protein